MDTTLVEVRPDSKISESLNAIVEKADVLNQNFDLDSLENADFEDLAIWFKQSEEILSIFKDIKTEISKILAKKMDGKFKTIDGLGTLERNPGYGPRKEWDEDHLLPLLYAKAIDDRKILDEETGEYESEAAAVLRVLKECARFEWRVGEKISDDSRGTALRRLGIDPDEYSTRVKGSPTVRFVK
jgi:hypothetical protein